MATTMTPARLCKNILSVMGMLPKQVAERIATNHSRTWSLVCLHDAGLCSPKPASTPDLATLWEVVNRARDEQLGLDTASRIKRHEQSKQEALTLHAEAEESRAVDRPFDE